MLSFLLSTFVSKVAFLCFHVDVGVAKVTLACFANLLVIICSHSTKTLFSNSTIASCGRNRCNSLVVAPVDLHCTHHADISLLNNSMSPLLEAVLEVMIHSFNQQCNQWYQDCDPGTVIPVP